MCINLDYCDLTAENLNKQEPEKSLVLSFSKDLASVRDKTGIRNVIKQYLKDIFLINEYIITVKNEDLETYSNFIHHSQAEEPADDGFNIVTDSSTPVVGSMTGAVLQSEEPVTFIIEEMLRDGKLSFPGASFWKAAGAEMIVGRRLRVAKQDIGILWTQDPEINSDILPCITAQISIAISNLMAKENISNREDERDLLLSLNTEIAAVRNNGELLRIINNKLKNLLSFSHTAIGMLNDDKVSISAFLLDAESKSKNHPKYQDVITSKIPINDGILNTALSSSIPAIFDLDELLEKQELPPYLRVNFECGIKQVFVVKLTQNDNISGVWIIFFEHNLHPCAGKLNLIKGFANQLSIAVSNIIANEDIKRREQEKSRLLSFSNAIASVTDKYVIAKILKHQLKELFSINDYVIHAISEDQQTCTPILYDSDTEFARETDFNNLTNHQNDVNDGVFNVILASEDPVFFDIAECSGHPDSPEYLKSAQSIGLKEMIGVSIRLADKSVGAMTFTHDDYNQIVRVFTLFKSILSQLAVIISNIVANQKIINQLEEINRYKNQLEEEKIYLKEEIDIAYNYSEIVGNSTEIQKICHLIGQVAQSDSTVLILGETGTGKELIARAIHNNSPRKNKMMVKVNCAALPENLIESELFGHEKGSFTGATERRLGKFELANQGTLFLDEIGEMPLPLQVKLLRALQEKEIERVGGRGAIKVDVRIIAATNRDLEREMSEGKFRADLYYRLNIFPIYSPPLRDRPNDILALTNHFINLFSKKAGRKMKTLSKNILQELLTYNWPGNIRELEHLIERSILLSTGDTIRYVDLPSQKGRVSLGCNSGGFTVKNLDENERDHILKTLKYCQGKIAGKGGASALLGVPASTLNSKMKKLGIRREHLV